MADRIIISIGEKRAPTIDDAVVVKVHENSYDIQLSNGELYSYVQNTSNVTFEKGNYVSIIFTTEERTVCRIIGTGKHISSISTIPEVIV